jgi:GntR family transcriptional regulator
MEERFNLIFDLRPNDPLPLYAQLERAIRHAIATEKLRVGEQLPTVRQLAIELRINANTVAKVYTELERAGLLETRRGVGTFVKTREAALMLFTKRRERERELRALVDRFVAEAAVLGFSLDDMLEYLSSQRTEGE